MNDFLIATESIGPLVQIIATGAFALYLLLQPQKTKSTKILLGLLFFLSLFMFSDFMRFSLQYTIWRLLLEQVRLLMVVLTLLLLMLLAYHFPGSLPSWPQELKRIFPVFVLLGMGITAYGWYEAYALVYFKPAPPDWHLQSTVLLVNGLWILIVLARRTIEASQSVIYQSHWVFTFLRPHGQTAKATRDFFVTITLPIFFQIFYLLSGNQRLINQILTLEILLLLLATFFVYLNYVQIGATIIGKLIGLGLGILLIAFSFIGEVIGPIREANYAGTPVPHANDVYRFAPQTYEGYQITRDARSWDQVWGTELALDEAKNTSIQLPFTFPFYVDRLDTLYLNGNGIVTLAHPYEWTAVAETRREPAIVPLLPVTAADDVRVFYKSNERQATVTWQQRFVTSDATDGRSNQNNTFQVVLYADGAFDFVYREIEQTNLHFVGVQPGAANTDVVTVDLANDLPMSFEGGFWYHINNNLRRHVDALLRPVALFIVGITLTILLPTPFFLQSVLIKPMNALVEGMNQVNEGNLDTTVQVPFDDEIGFMADSFNNMVQSLKNGQTQLRFTNQAYSRFVPVSLLQLLERESIVDVRLGDQTKMPMSVLFADIREFTLLSQQMTSQEIFAYVNDWLSFVGPIIRRHDGFVDKYLAGGVMALFPETPDDAVQAALDLQTALLTFNDQKAQSGLPVIRMGIGIHTGELILGVIGEAGRLDGTVIADVVNTASRLEKLTKQYEADIIISQATLSRLTRLENSDIAFLQTVRAKGKQNSIQVYAVQRT